MSKEKLLSLILIFLAVIGVIGMATFGYLYFSQRSELANVKSQLENLKKEEKKGDNSEQVVEESEVEFQVATKEFLCPDWTYADTTTGTPKLSIVYGDISKVTFENLNSECEEMVMKYKEAKLYITYSHGEAYPLGFKTGTETVSLKKGLSKDGIQLTLGRQKYVEKEAASSTYPAGYWVNYVVLLSEAECTDSTVQEAPGFPCYLSGNPFVTPAGNFSLYIPLSKSSEEILQIVEYFDEVAKSSSYEIVK